MNGSEFIKTKQLLWANRNDIILSGSQGDKGLPIYTLSINENLFEPLSSIHVKELQDGDGGELVDSSKGAAKMKALHSSSAIAVNIFHYWSSINKVHHLAHALGFCNASNHSSQRVVFEKKYEIDKSFGRSPNIDVVIENSEESTFNAFAIECKFSEAYGSYKHSGVDEKYLDIETLWTDIPNLQTLATSISPNDDDNKYLHPAQLIKHILGLKNAYGKSKFKLLYLWYDVLGDDGYLHRKEIERFSEIAKADKVNFIAMSYQELIRNLSKHYLEGNELYINYISDRYM